MVELEADPSSCSEEELRWWKVMEVDGRGIDSTLFLRSGWKWPFFSQGYAWHLVIKKENGHFRNLNWQEAMAFYGLLYLRFRNFRILEFPLIGIEWWIHDDFKMICRWTMGRFSYRFNGDILNQRKSTDLNFKSKTRDLMLSNQKKAGHQTGVFRDLPWWVSSRGKFLPPTWHNDCRVNLTVCYWNYGGWLNPHVFPIYPNQS